VLHFESTCGFPDAIAQLPPRLTELRISGCVFEQLPEGGYLRELRVLELESCPTLRRLPTLFHQCFPHLRTLSLVQCPLLRLRLEASDWKCLCSP
jgi:hypothetical protein